MALHSLCSLDDALPEVDLPTEVFFAHPDDVPSTQDDEALRQFLLEMEDDGGDDHAPCVFLIEDDLG